MKINSKSVKSFITKIITKLYSNSNIYAFLLSVFLFKLPSVYFFPTISNPFFTTQSLARIIIIILFFITQYKQPFYKSNQYNTKYQRIIIALLISLFIALSLSIMPAINIESFIKRYKDIVIGFMAFFVFFSYKSQLVSIAKVFIVSTVVSLMYQSLLLVRSDTLLSLLQYYIYQGHWSVVISKLINQGKLYTDTYDEITIPILFTHLHTKNKFKFVCSLFLLGAIIFFAFVSNIRTRIIMVLFSILGSLIFLISLSKKRILLIAGMVFLIVLLANSAANSLFKYSFIDRFTLQDEQSDIQPITGRFEQIQISLEMAKNNLLGVGLGNYYDNLDSSQKNIGNSYNWNYPSYTGPSEYVHNLLAITLVETGYIGFLLFIFLILFFIKNDVNLIKKGTEYQKAFVLSFWTLFIFALFNPPIPASYQVLFWGMRGLLL